MRNTLLQGDASYEADIELTEVLQSGGKVSKITASILAEPNLFPGRAGNFYRFGDPIRLTIEDDQGKPFMVTITGAEITGTTGTEYQATLALVQERR